MIKFLYKNEYQKDVFLQTSAKRMITYKEKLLKDQKYFFKENTFFLSFPNIVFFFNKKPYTTEPYLNLAFSNPTLTEFYYPALPNIYANCSVCMGIMPNETPLIDQFWKSNFNDEIKNGSFAYYKDFPQQSKIYLSFKEKFINWQTKTKENPNWIPNHTEMIPVHPNIQNYFKPDKIYYDQIPQNSNHE